MLSSALLRRELLQLMSCCSKTMQGAAINYPVAGSAWNVAVMSRGIEVVRPYRAPAQYQLRYLQRRLRRMDLETQLYDTSISSAVFSAISTSLPKAFWRVSALRRLC
jgi:hypothetical protein